MTYRLFSLLAPAAAAFWSLGCRLVTTNPGRHTGRYVRRHATCKHIRAARPEAVV